MVKTYEIEFIDLDENKNQFEILVRLIDAKDNANARTNFKREMKSEFGAIEGKDYKIEHITLHTLLRNKMKISEGYFEAKKNEKNYGRYEIGYKEGENIFYTGHNITANTEKEAIDKYMKIEPTYIRNNVHANRI